MTSKKSPTTNDGMVLVSVFNADTDKPAKLRELMANAWNLGGELRITAISMDSTVNEKGFLVTEPMCVELWVEDSEEDWTPIDTDKLIDDDDDFLILDSSPYGREYIDESY